MVVKAEQERVRGLIADTVTLLCRNGLQYKSKFCINALIGITLDEEDVFLVDIRETIKNAEVDVNSEADSATSDETPSKSSSRKRKRHRKRSKSNIESAKADTAPQSESASEAGSLNTGVDNEKLDNDNSSEPPEKRLVKQEEDDEDSQDLVFIKDEPADSDLSSSAFGNLSHLYQQQQSETSSGVLDSMSQQGHMYGQAQSGADGLPGPSSWGDQTFSSMQPSVQNTMPNASTSSGATDSQSQVSAVSGGLRLVSQHSAAAYDRPWGPQRAAPAPAPDVPAELYERQPDGRFICALCRRDNLTAKRHLVAHLAHKHGRTDLMVRCPWCSKPFGRVDNMRTHMDKCKKTGGARMWNIVAPCNEVITPDNKVITPGNEFITPSNEVIVPGNKVIAPGNNVIAPGNSTDNPQTQWWIAPRQ